MIHVLHVRQIDRYFAGTLRPAAATEMLRRLLRCAACRVRYERHLLYERVLPDGDARQQERLWQSIVASARAETPLTATSPTTAEVVRPSFRPFRPSLFLGTAALASLMLLVAVGAHFETVSGPVARGSAVEEVGAPTVHLFRTVDDHQTESVT